MPALAPPPPPVPAAHPAPAANLPRITGRSLAEYSQFFALDIPALRSRDVLDVAGGASSFTAEACARRIDAVAVDPQYGRGLPALAFQVERDLEAALAENFGLRRNIRHRAFPSWPAEETECRATVLRFLADYETHVSHSRYVAGSLPLLPFFDDTFDLVLCAHLLFGDAGCFDFDWHLAACRELVRVSAGEVRVFPLGGTDGKVFPGLSRLRRELRESGVTSIVRSVAPAVLPGSASMLVLGAGG